MHGATRQLWRLTSTSQSAPLPVPEPLAVGLRLHVSHAALDSVLVQIGSAQQSYVALTGCGGCARGRCEPGCRVEMFQRLLDRHGAGLTLHYVAGGLAPRPYTRAVVAVPGRAAQLDSALLHPWPEARLVAGWRPGRRHGVQASVLLVVGAEGPCPSEVLRAHGWQPWPVPTTLLHRWACAAIPLACPLTWQRHAAPTLLLPAAPALAHPAAADVQLDAQLAPAHPTAPNAQLDAPLAHVPPNGPDAQLDVQLTTWLTSLLAQPHQPAEADVIPPQDEIASPWPAGPGALNPAALGTLVAQLIAEPSFQSTRKGQSGLSKGRLAGLRAAGLSENVARALMVWFDRAGVLAQPEDGQSPWRAPRPFALTDLDAIAVKLRDTPLPTSEEIRAAYGGEA